MKLLNLVIAALLISPKAFALPQAEPLRKTEEKPAVETPLESPFAKKIQNPVGYDYMSTVHRGQTVYVRALSNGKGLPHYAWNAYVETQITRISTQAPPEYGQIRAELKPMDVEVRLKQGYDRVYHIAQLGLTQGIFSGYFSLQDTVIFPVQIGSRTTYQNGTVVAIVGGGDLLVKKGLNVIRVKAENLFSTNRNYLNSKHRVGEEITLQIFRGQSKIFTLEKAYVTAISPLGEALVSTAKSYEPMRLSANDERVINLVKSCKSFFQ